MCSVSFPLCISLHFTRHCTCCHRTPPAHRTTYVSVSEDAEAMPVYLSVCTHACSVCTHSPGGQGCAGWDDPWSAAHSSLYTPASAANAAHSEIRIRNNEDNIMNSSRVSHPHRHVGHTREERDSAQRIQSKEDPLCTGIIESHHLFINWLRKWGCGC